MLKTTTSKNTRSMTTVPMTVAVLGVTMIGLSSSSLSLILSVNAQEPPPPRMPCNICTEGFLALPTGIVGTIGTYAATCSNTQLVGASVDYGFTPQQCKWSQLLSNDPCGCPNSSGGGGSSSSQQQNDISSSMIDDPTFQIYCEICPNGDDVSLGFGATIGEQTCSSIQQRGRQGQLRPSECLAAQIRAAMDDNVCGCGSNHVNASGTSEGSSTSASGGGGGGGEFASDPLSPTGGSSGGSGPPPPGHVPVPFIPAAPVVSPTLPAVPPPLPTSPPVPAPAVVFPTSSSAAGGAAESSSSSSSSSSSAVSEQQEQQGGPGPAPTPPVLVTPGRSLCNICGEGSAMLQNADVVFSPETGITCGQTQAFAYFKGMTTDECTVAQMIAYPICGCVDDPSLQLPPPMSPEDTAVIVGRMEQTVSCTVCSNGRSTFSENSLFPGGDTCAFMDYLARKEELTLNECLNLRLAAGSLPGDPCECDGPSQPSLPSDPSGTDSIGSSVETPLSEGAVAGSEQQQGFQPAEAMAPAPTNPGVAPINAPIPFPTPVPVPITTVPPAPVATVPVQLPTPLPPRNPPPTPVASAAAAVPTTVPAVPTSPPTIPASAPISGVADAAAAAENGDDEADDVADSDAEKTSAVSYCTGQNEIEVMYTVWMSDPSDFEFDLSLLVDLDVVDDIYNLRPAPTYFSGVSCLLPPSQLGTTSIIPPAISASTTTTPESSPASSSTTPPPPPTSTTAPVGRGVGSFAGDGNNRRMKEDKQEIDRSFFDESLFRSSGSNSTATNSNEEGDNRSSTAQSRRRRLQDEEMEGDNSFFGGGANARRYVSYGARLQSIGNRPGFFRDNLIEYTIRVKGPRVDPDRSLVKITQDDFNFFGYPETGVGGSIIGATIDEFGISCSFVAYGQYRYEEPQFCTI